MVISKTFTDGSISLRYSLRSQIILTEIAGRKRLIRTRDFLVSHEKKIRWKLSMEVASKEIIIVKWYISFDKRAFV